MTAVTVDLLDALLSPDHEKRSHGEAYLQSLAVEERCRSLLQFLATTATATAIDIGSSSHSTIVLDVRSKGGTGRLTTNNNNYNNNNHKADPTTSYVMLAAVLLRRDILRLTNAFVLQELVTPLLSLFFTTTSSTHHHDNMMFELRRHAGHCLAAICQTLTILNQTTECDATMNMIFHHILPLCTTSTLDIPSIRLAATLADRAPQSFQRIGAVQMIPPLLQAALPTCAHPPSSDQGKELMDALMEMLVFAAIAVSSKSHHDDDDTVVVELGQSGLLPLLPHFVSCFGLGSNQMIPSLQTLAHAAAVCPVFLVGKDGSWTLLRTVTRALQEVAATEYLATKAQLSCLQVLATLYATPLVQRAVQHGFDDVLPTGAHDGILYACARLMVDGIHGNIANWAAEPLSISDKEADLRWDEDRIADDAEALFESFLQSMEPSKARGALYEVLHRIIPVKTGLYGTIDERSGWQRKAEWKHQMVALAMMQCHLVTTSPPETVYSAEKILELANSENLRVQYRALWYLGVVFELRAELYDCDPSRIVSSVLQLVATSKCGKVVCMALDVLSSFCQASEKEDVASYLSHVLPTLLAAPWQLSTDDDLVPIQVRTLHALSCWAAAAGETMVPYYPQVMPSLLSCIQAQAQIMANSHSHNHNNYEAVTILGAAVEAASMMGVAVGQDHLELFRSDAHFLLQQVLGPLLMLQQQQESNDGDDDELEFVCTASARIASVMGKEFLPFVPILLPHLLRRATLPPDVDITEGDDSNMDTARREDVDDGTESMTVTLPGRGSTKVTVNVSKIQSKALAARAVYELAISLESDFRPFAPSCLEAFLSLVTFPYSSEVRSTAAQTLAAVFQSVCPDDEELGDMTVSKQYLPHLITTIAKQVEEETSSGPDVLFNLTDALSDILYAAYRNLKKFGSSRVVENVGFEHANAAAQSVMKAMAACLERRKQPKTAASFMDQAADSSGREEQLLTALVDSVGCMLKLMRQNFAPIFDGVVVPVLETYLVTQHPDTNGRHAALCLWDDCIEHCGPSAVARHASQLAVGVVLGVNDVTNGQDANVKQAALYGLCQLSRFAPTFVLEPRSFLSALLATCRNDMASSHVAMVTNQNILENSVSALAFMALIGKAPFASLALELVSKENLLGLFLNNLPLREDEDEAKICHAGLCDLVQQGQISLALQVQHLVRIIGETLESVSSGEEVATPATCFHMVQLLRDMQHHLPAEQMELAFGELSTEAQTAIQEAMQHHALQQTTVVTP